MHLKASEWFDKNNYKEEAVKHVIKANDIKAAANLVSSYRHELMEAGQMHRFVAISTNTGLREVLHYI